MSYSIPSMEDIRLRIRAALDVARPGIDGKGLARELGIPPSQVTSLLKPGGRTLRIDEISVVERYLGIKLFDVAAQDDCYGTPEQKQAVRAALDALLVFNERLDRCYDLGVECSLAPAGPAYYANFFTKKKAVIP